MTESPRVLQISKKPLAVPFNKAARGFNNKQGNTTSWSVRLL